MKDSTPLDRRGFLKIARRYGYTSALLAVAGTAGPLTLATVGKAAAQTEQERDKTAMRTLTFGAAGFNPANLRVQESGQLWFARKLEENTDGALKVDFIGNNAICNQGDCVKKTQQGIIDMFAASTQNSAGSAPYYNALDFAYMFPSRASQHHFFYSKKSEPLFREPMRRLHNIEFLYTHCELRGLMMGKKFEDAPLITSVEELAGTKNRVTGTQLGRLAMELMDLNPVPIAWEETLDGLKQGLIDGAETWMGAAAYANMSPVLSQAVDLRFFCGTEQTAMNAETFQSLDPEIQDIVKETAYEAQQYTQIENERALVEVTGAVENPPPGTVFGDAGVRVATLSDATRKQAEEMCSPEYRPAEWEMWIERMAKMNGEHDVYREIYDIAREIPADMDAVDVVPVRWWES